MVSVIVPVYNGEATLARALESALAQEFSGDVEVIVVNDGSTDDTAKVLERFRGRITVVTQHNRGLSGARNAGVRVARGTYLAFLDADDLWLPKHLAESVAALEANDRAVVAYSEAVLMHADGTRLEGSFIADEFAHAPSMADLLTRWWPILPSTVVMRRSIFDACEGFCTSFRRAYEDLDFWLRAREQGEFEYIAEPTVRYRITPIAERMHKYENDYLIFARRVRERYGRQARALLKSTRHAYVNAFGYRGLTAMRDGDLVAARRAFAHALRYEPFNRRNAMRFLRCYLPRPVAQVLTGRTRTRQTSEDCEDRTQTSTAGH